MLLLVIVGNAAAIESKVRQRLTRGVAIYKEGNYVHTEYCKWTVMR